MRKAQQALASFLPLINWKHFRRKNLNKEILVSDNAFAAFGCGDNEQAILWLLRTTSIKKNGILDQDCKPLSICAHIPRMSPGHYHLTVWDTKEGKATNVFETDHTDKKYLSLPLLSIATDLAFAIKRVGDR
jgi:mannan endo-1,4-beta-mannosidase